MAQEVDPRSLRSLGSTSWFSAIVQLPSRGATAPSS